MAGIAIERGLTKVVVLHVPSTYHNQPRTTTKGMYTSRILISMRWFSIPELLPFARLQGISSMYLT